MVIKKNSYVRIKRTILDPQERSSNLPKETQKVPFNMWTKGYLVDDAKLLDIVKVKTKTGRIEQGTLKEVNPHYKHNYGDFIPEILKIEEIILSEMRGEDHE